MIAALGATRQRLFRPWGGVPDRVNHFPEQMPAP